MDASASTLQTAPFLVLASASPRRRELLGLGRLPFRVEPSPFDESSLPYRGGEPVAAWVERLSLAKARAVAVPPGGIVLGADTAVVRGDRVYGKPADNAQALQFLRELGGGWHEVITAIALVGESRTVVKHRATRVQMRAMPDAELIAYVETGEPLDKAGAYAIQGGGSIVVDRIEGCYTNVVGLSLPLLDQMLAADFGLTLLGPGTQPRSPAGP